MSTFDRQSFAHRLDRLNRRSRQATWLLLLVALAVVVFTGFGFYLGRQRAHPPVQDEMQTAAKSGIPPKTASEPVIPKLAISESPPDPGPKQALPIAEAPLIPDTSRPHPSHHKISEAEFLSASERIYVGREPEHSFGRVIAFQALIWTELTLLASGKRASSEEYYALACYYARREFAAPKMTNGLPPETRATNFRKGIDDFYPGYVHVMSAKQNDPVAFENGKDGFFKLLNDPQYCKDTKVAMTANELLAELTRYRKEGALASNQPLRSNGVNLAEGQRKDQPKSIEPMFKVGDKVCNKGILLTWAGTIVSAKDPRFDVRIDYTHADFNKSGFVKGKTYPLVAGEFKQMTAQSIDYLLRKLK